MNLRRLTANGWTGWHLLGAAVMAAMAVVAACSSSATPQPTSAPVSQAPTAAATAHTGISSTSSGISRASIS